MRLPIRTTATLAAVTLVASGCGLLGRPSVSSQEDVLAAFGQLVDAGFRTRVSADLAYVEQEVRNALAANPDALAMLEGELDGEDTDEMLAQLEELAAEVDRHALLVEVGADRSARYAVESDGTVWADLRVLGPTSEQVEAGELPVTMQLAADIPFATGVFGGEAPDTDELVDGMAGLFAGSEGGDEVIALITAVLEGDLVEMSGDIAAVGESLMGDLGVTEEDVASATDPFGFGELELDPRAFIDTAFTFSGFRVEDGLTVVDVTVNVRAAATSIADTLDQVADSDAGDMLPTEDLADMRAEVADLPETLENIATLRLDGDGNLNQVRVDLLDLVLQVAEHEDPTDPELTAMRELAADLDESGLFLVVDVDGVGSTPTVMGTPAASTDFETFVSAAFAVFFGGVTSSFGSELGALGLEGMDSLEDFEGLDDLSFEDPLSVTAIAVGDCFDEALRYGTVDGATTFSCDQPHMFETFATVPLTGPYDDAVLGDAAYQGCLDAFASFVGVDYYASELFVESLIPTADEYAQGITDAVCFLSSFASETGSAAGSGR